MTATESSFDEITIGPCSASNPNPANAATGVSRTVLLTWSPCAGTVRNDVYFGTNSSVVSNGTTPTYTTSGNSYSPGTLEYLRTYYWRVDEFDGASTSKGSVWSFTTVSAAHSCPPSQPPKVRANGRLAAEAVRFTR